MRQYFDLKEFEPFSVTVDGQEYPFSDLKPALARKERPAANISEFIFQLPSQEYVYLTVVGDEGQNSAFGVAKGWYVVEKLSTSEAEFAIDAFAKFTDMYKDQP